jgi:hypothetical protein
MKRGRQLLQASQRFGIFVEAILMKVNSFKTRAIQGLRNGLGSGIIPSTYL